MYICRFECVNLLPSFFPIFISLIWHNVCSAGTLLWIIIHFVNWSVGISLTHALFKIQNNYFPNKHVQCTCTRRRHRGRERGRASSRFAPLINSYGLFSFLCDFFFFVKQKTTNNSNSNWWWFVSNKLIWAQHTNTYHFANNSFKMQFVSICIVRNKSFTKLFRFPLIFFIFFNLHLVCFQRPMMFFSSFNLSFATKGINKFFLRRTWERFKRCDCFASKCSLSVCEFENEQYWMDRTV